MSVGAVGQYAVGQIPFEGTGVFVLSGPDVELSHFIPNKNKLAAVGELAVGQFADAGITAVFDVGTFTLTGQDLSFDHVRNIPCDVGTFTLSGQDISIKAGLFLVGETGVFTLTGQDATVARGPLSLTSDVGTFVLTGQDIEFRDGYSVPLDTGEFVLTGQSLEFARVSKRIRLNLRGGGSSNIRLRAA